MARKSIDKNSSRVTTPLTTQPTASYKVGPNTVTYDPTKVSAGGDGFAFGTQPERSRRTRNNQVQNPPAQMSQIGPADVGGAPLTMRDPRSTLRTGNLKFGRIDGIAVDDAGQARQRVRP